MRRSRSRHRPGCCRPRPPLVAHDISAGCRSSNASANSVCGGFTPISTRIQLSPPSPLYSSAPASLWKFAAGRDEHLARIARHLADVAAIDLALGVHRRRASRGASGRRHRRCGTCRRGRCRSPCRAASGWPARRAYRPHRRSGTGRGSDSPNARRRRWSAACRRPRSRRTGGRARRRSRPSSAPRLAGLAPGAVVISGKRTLTGRRIQCSPASSLR